MTEQEKGIYNAGCKEQFLSMYPVKSGITYRNFFDKTKHVEHRLEKDIYEFELPEIEDFFTGLHIDYISTARSYGRICTKYVDWAISKGYKNNNENPLRNVRTKWFEQFVREEAKIFYSRKEISEILDDCVNAQDSVIVCLVFEGILGQAGAEIRNLKISDIDFVKHRLNLTDNDGSRRVVEVTSDCIALLVRAISEKKYYKSNGKMEGSGNVRDFTELIESEYVIRSSNTGKEKNLGAIDKFVLYRRIESIEKQLDLENFTIKNISRSGMIALAHQLVQDYSQEKLNLTIVIEVSHRFKVNSYNSLHSFVNDKTIAKIYGEKYE
ncbi:tyrosine-type recombinase/integrase [Paenibacillus radicis (ex Xue et al. 2023)]|uniref:Site-specific integrase n=1 Tax=Paenibacillus radicis (ex Xue et al. 2023) TaxID=2972489 RepID=A0ABT1YL71_9BACL|nr:site-specific integrase [Paenibacillus radicis (ex Xue et al. 2023)]MCR8633932.1 site-specific integrase [Paenibacillus radicis (ex Xue et al. 2023)]